MHDRIKKLRYPAAGAGLRLCLGALSAGVLASCAVGPDFHRPAPPAVKSYLPDPLPEQAGGSGGGEPVQRFAPGADVADQWWKAYQSTQLDGLVADALAANPTVAAAKATLVQAQELAAAQRGNYWPQVQASFGASRQENATGVLSPTLGSGEPQFNLFTPQLAVSFVPDLFGANRRQVESLLAAADAARYELAAAHITLVNNVIATVVQAAALQDQVRETERIIALEGESLEVLRHSLSLGAVSGADVAAQETALAQAQASLPPLRHQLEVQRHQLAVLTGRLPQDSPVLHAGLDDLRVPADIPLGVPSRLIEHRPDVLVAEAQLHAATAQVGVSIANMLPQFTITGGVGSVATVMSDMFKAGTGFWSVGGTLSQTLFAGGSLWHRKRAADAALDAAGFTYRATVLSAFQNVADCLHALLADAQAQQATARAATAAETSFNIARRQLDLGAADELALMVTEQNYLQARIALLQARANRLADTAAFYQALGGAAPGAATP